MNQPLVIFDLDGTLINTAPDLMASLNHVLLHEGIDPVSYEDINIWVGQGARAMIEKAFVLRNAPLDEAQMPALLDLLIAHYLENMPGESEPYPFVERTLQQLRAEGFLLAICTNKMTALTMPLIEGMGLAHYFDAITCGDTFEVRKPDPGHITGTIDLVGGRADNAVMVGDSINDILAANNAGVASVAVDFGYSDRPVDQLGAKVIASSFETMTPEFFRSLLK